MTMPSTTAATEVESAFRILLVEDDPTIADILSDALREQGHVIYLARDGDAAMRFADERTYDLVISDVRLPGVDGLTLLRHLQSVAPITPVVLMSAYGTVREAVSAIRESALHYLSKPFDLDELLSLVREVAQRSAARRSVVPGAGDSPAFARLIGDSTHMRNVRRLLLAASESDVPVVIHGESGTGKELAARAIHELGARRARPFVAVNCASIPETLFEAELFGHERGAFTGAVQRREGMFRAAEGGTIFLDEIADIPLTLQSKLLRVLQERVVQPLGTDKTVRVDVRVVSATNLDLRTLVAERKFREDLYYRLRVLDIRLPALRERGGDLPFLVGHFLARFGVESRAKRVEITPRVWAALSAHAFPGNVRELEHALQHALALCGDGPIDLQHLPDELSGRQVGDMRECDEPIASLAEARTQFEREYLARALERANGSKTRAAEMLRISRKSMWERLKRHGMG